MTDTILQFLSETKVPPIGFIFLLIVSQLFLIPITPIEIASGFLFGFPVGTLYTLTGKLLSAFLNYTLSQTVAKNPATKLTSKFPLLQGIQTSLVTGGWKIATLIRLCPIPFGAVSFAFGLTSLSKKQYAVATLLSILPTTLAFSALGASLKTVNNRLPEGSGFLR
jgi:uncharacterized membrane protein YdjX (TVP38/TMEM64 family)